MKQVALVLCAALTAMPAVAATTYKWVDNNGVVHYSDQPHAGAKAVNLPGLSSFAAKPVPTSAAPDNAQPGNAGIYQKVAIASPRADATIHANDGKVPVSVTLVPPLRRSDQLVYQVDGQAIGQPTTATSMTLTHVARGAHTVAVAVKSAQGDIVATSPAVSFYVRHHSVLHPKSAFSFPRGPAQNPP